MSVDIITGPAFLAPALVNGDTSGLSQSDLECLERFAESIAPWVVVGTANNSESYFTWSYPLYGGNADGGDVIEYVVHKAD